MDQRLLVLDDDDGVAATIARIAVDEGFEVRLSNGAASFFALIDSGWPTHLAIDLVMPTMDGVEVLRSLAERHCGANIIVTSGMGTKVLESAQRYAVERGLLISGILPKPFRAQTLRELLKRSRSIASPGVTPRRGFDLCKGDIDAALREDQFVLHYQPKIRLDDGVVIGFEALVRWNHPDLGLVMPDQFIGTSERTGQVIPLTYRIFELGIAWLASCPIPWMTLAFNLSAHSLADLGLADRLQELCTRWDIAPPRISLELTETSAMADPVAAFDVLTRLRIKGFALAIDDFGTGYSSMLQLVRLPFTEIKIDKSFVLSMLGSHESRKIVYSILRLAKELSMTTVAEGVETDMAYTLLKKQGCQVAQGFLFSRPLDGEAALQWLSRHSLASPAPD